MSREKVFPVPGPGRYCAMGAGVGAAGTFGRALLRLQEGRTPEELRQLRRTRGVGDGPVSLVTSGEECLEHGAPPGG